jgi:hypothetical protein
MGGWVRAIEEALAHFMREALKAELEAKAKETK